MMSERVFDLKEFQKNFVTFNGSYFYLFKQHSSRVLLVNGKPNSLINEICLANIDCPGRRWFIRQGGHSQTNSCRRRHRDSIVSPWSVYSKSLRANYADNSITLPADKAANFVDYQAPKSIMSRLLESQEPIPMSLLANPKS